MFNKFKKAYISIEIVVIAAVVLIGGLAGTSAFLKNGQNAQSQSAAAMNNTIDMIEEEFDFSTGSGELPGELPGETPEEPGEQPGGGTITPDGPGTNEEEYQLSGTWVFNETLVLPEENIYQEMTYTVDYEYYDINVKPESVDFYNFEPSYFIDGWLHDSFRTITFAETQIVGKEFYEWFIANASIKSSESEYALSGTWKFNATPTKYATERTFVANVNGFVDGAAFNSMEFIYMDTHDDYLANFSSAEGSQIESRIEWSEIKTLTISFESAQEVSPEFYEWFVANLTKQ